METKPKNDCKKITAHFFIAVLRRTLTFKCLLRIFLLGVNLIHRLFVNSETCVGFSAAATAAAIVAASAASSSTTPASTGLRREFRPAPVILSGSEPIWPAGETVSAAARLPGLSDKLSAGQERRQ